jgi:tRNA threonylcarbamoyl adenosine modification protein YeaZ
LLIDSSGFSLVCALAEGNRIAAELSADPRGPDIGAAVAAVLQGHAKEDLESIVVGIGPGSFIGTRTAISFANGYAAASGIPLAGVNSLAAIAAVQEQGLAVLRDARRGQWYVWTPDGNCGLQGEKGALELLQAGGNRGVVVEQVGDAAPPLIAVALNAAGFKVTYAASVPALGMLRAASGFERQAYVEPIYLRGFT